MCDPRRWMLGLLLLVCAGCFTSGDSRGSRLRSNRVSALTDGIYLDYLVVERNEGDSYLNGKLWNDVDEMAIPVDSRPMTRANGFRIGLIGGLISPEVQTLIANPRNSQGVRRRQVAVGVAKPLTVGGVIPSLEFALHQPDQESRTVKHEQAQCQLNVTAWEGEGGKVRLEFVPEVQYSDKKHWIPPGAVGAGWLREKPTESFAEMAFEVSLSPTEYLLIGTRYEADGTLGQRAFTGESNRTRVQRLLILRAGKLNQSLPLGDFFNEEAPRKATRVVPLALQASSSRASGEKP